MTWAGLKAKLTFRRVVGWYIAGLWVWPALHFVLCQAFDLHPWKFAGWAMYTQPAPQTRVSVSRGPRSGMLSQAYLMGSIPGGAEAYNVYTATRELWGRLAPAPTHLAKLVLGQFPDLKLIWITVGTRSMSSSGSIELQLETYECLRSSSTSGADCTKR